MQHIELNYGQIKDNREKFSKILKKSNTIVLFKCEAKNVCQIKLVEQKVGYSIDHLFEADGFITGDDVRECKDIDRDLIKKLITPKVDFRFNIYGDAYTNKVLKEHKLHSDVIFLKIGDLESLFYVKTTPDNSARMINYGV